MSISSLFAPSCLSSCLPALLVAAAAVRAGEGSEERVDFARDVEPIFAQRCLRCHAGERAKGGFRLDARKRALRGGNSGEVAIAPRDPAGSRLLALVRDGVEGTVMPPKGERLDAVEIATLERWIAQGAHWPDELSGDELVREHWSFVPPAKAPLPEVARAWWPRTEVDAFVLAAMEARGLAPAPAADRATLLRRLSFDLIGLPPEPADVARFLADEAPGALEREVERLLASPHFGERWARTWLDLARYADSAGYGSDPLRPFLWRWRDWVIEAFDRNLPYDEFTVLQLAGDLLPDATVEQRLATAFHRNTMTNTEGGTDDEEFRVAAVKDRTDTTMAVWMGLTFGCAKCHSHKFDPLPQRDYYALAAFFDQTEDADRADEEPRLATPTAAQARELARLDADLAACRRLVEELRAALPPREWTRATAAPVSTGDRTVLEGEADGLAALRLEVAATALPEGEVRLEVAQPEPVASRARFVRLSLAGRERILSLAEVELLAGGENVARRGRATQSSVDWNGPPGLAIDGERDGRFERASVTHTRTEDDPWWELDLGEERALDTLVVWNRTDGELEERLAGVVVELLDARRAPVWRTRLARAPAPSTTLDLAGWRELEPRREERLADALEIEYAAPLAGPLRWRLELGAGWHDVHAAGALRVATTAAALPAALSDELDRRVGVVRARADLEAQVVRTPVLRELPPDRRRTSHVLHKANHLQPGAVVTPATPRCFPPLPADAPRDRLGLARWLVARENPLTARVAVNRFWAQLFGRGLVETEEDFGTQGSPPSHPELLDWLAVDFVESGWDVKRLLAKLVTSAAYGQACVPRAGAREADPRDVWLSWHPRRRLDAEMVRDQALALSGLLARTIGGPSVYPPQPDGLWQAAFNGERTYPTSTGPDRWRRGLYTFWRRTVPPPSLQAFDAPSRESCVLRRPETNTPLQAFVTLNDPVFVEAAQALARRIVREGGAGFDERLEWAWRLALLRAPDAAERAALRELFEGERARLFADREAALALCERPLGLLEPGLDPAEVGAWVVVANVLLNLDALLVRG